MAQLGRNAPPGGPRRPGGPRSRPRYRPRPGPRTPPRSRSVSEVAALTGVPLGVARVLIDDLVGERRLLVHGCTSAEDGPGLELMERVLSGLRGL